MGSHNEENVKLGKSLRAFFAIFSKYKWQAIVILVVVFIIEAVGVLDKFLLKFFIDFATEFTAGTLSQGMFMRFSWILLSILVGVMVLRTIGRWYLVDRANHIAANMAVDLKSKMYNHIIRLPHSFHTNHKTGSLISRMMRASSAIEAISDVFLYSLVPIIIQIITVIGSLLALNYMSALVIIAYVIASLSFSYYVQMEQVQPQVDYNKAEDEEKGFISDSFTNIESVKLYGKENYMGSRFDTFIHNTKKKLLSFWGFWRWSEAGLIGITGAATIAVVTVTGYQFFQNSMSLGTLVFTYTVFVGMIGPLQSFQWGMRGLYRGLGDFESLRAYLDAPNEIQDKPDAKDISVRRGSIDFKEVTFHYNKKQVFEKLDLKIKPNTTVALVGKSGSGKSTLVKLLFRLYDVESGAIIVDGTDVKDVKQQSLRSSMSVVPQECILFDDTLYNNILFAKPEASRAEVLKAISLAQLDSDIEGMPLKENTIVGERGVKLSGGEKQRVSIARAILADKKIMVLDEATSALDSETEFAIKKALAHLMKGRTSIIIAHRLSTIMSADDIVVLRNGQIVQHGTHATLSRQKGEYKRLWNLQKGGYIK